MRLGSPARLISTPTLHVQKQSKLTSTSRKGKKKKERKSKSKKSVAAAKSSERKFFHDISRLQKSRSVTPLREDTNWKDDGPYPSPLEPLHPIVTDNACPPTAKPGDDTPECVGVGNVVVDTNEGEVKEEEEKNNAAQPSPRDSEIQPIIEADLGVERQPTLETAESDSESPEEQRRESLQRSCSMNALDDLKTTQPLPKRRIKSSNEVGERERERKREREGERERIRGNMCLISRMKLLESQEVYLWTMLQMTCH